MTDDTEKDVLMNGGEGGWSEEELDAMIVKDELIKMKCTQCGHIEKAPDWIIGEFGGENRAMGSKEEVQIECPVCNGGMERIR